MGKVEAAGRPTDGPLYEDKCDTRKLSDNLLHTAGQLRLERSKIQSRDQLFRDKNWNRFKSSKSKSVCRGVKIDNVICTDSRKIADHFRTHFANLATSSISSQCRNAESDIAHIEITSFLSCNDILDSEYTVGDIECALKTLKLGKSGGSDLLDPA